MAKSIKKTIREKLDSLKRSLDKAINPGNKQHLPQLILEPVRNKTYLRGTGLH
jgi:hypothetical protein